jgi:glyoxylate/hydroxypyruvate reductase A
VDYAVVGKPDPGAIAALPNLKVIFSINAGVEALLADDTVPAHLPLVRMVDHGLTKGMVEWVAAKVLDFHRNGPAYRLQQAAGEWRQLPEFLAEERTIGVLGLGELGASVAALLAAIGFKVLGWSRTARDLPNIDCQQGAEGLTYVLSQAQILVNLLPLTPETIGLLNRKTLSLLPKGSYLINAARGRHIVDQDLLDLLDDGHLTGAALDVFSTEPLPNSDPFWRHPKISITPHVAAVTHARTAVEAIAANLLGYEAGQPLSFLVERGRGY